MLKRFFSSVFLFSILFGTVFLDGWPGTALFVAVGAMLAYCLMTETSAIFSKIFLSKTSPLLPFMGIFFFLLSFLCACLNLRQGIAFFLPSSLMICIFWIFILMHAGNKEGIFSDIISGGAFFLVMLPISSLLGIYMFNEGGLDGRRLLVFMVIVTKSADIGGYLGGTVSSALMKGGNHKILPSISPKKSWEGTICGLLLSVFTSLYFAETFGVSKTGMLPALLGVLLFFGSFFGDMAESSLKRAASLKDSGKTIPGIGGALDLMDSFLLNAPVFYGIILFSANHLHG